MIACPKVAIYNDHIIEKGKTPLFECATAPREALETSIFVETPPH